MIESITYDKNQFKIIFKDIVTSKEIFEANEYIIKHQEFKTSLSQLWIYSDVKDVQLESEEIRRVAVQDKKASLLNPDIKVAIVSNELLSFGLSRTYQSYCRVEDLPWEVFVTYSLDEAQEWLN